MDLELLTLNAFGSVRPATRDGRAYLVANGTIIVPGVLPGSKGPLYYPEAEVRNSAPLWDGVDIVLRHPTDPRTGAPLSAKAPGVLARVGMGLLQNTTFSRGRLGTELWFDVRNAERLDATLAPDLRVLPKLRAGRPVELSTGLYTKQRPAPLGAVFNGRSYTAVATAYRPDHLAVLPDETGACSIRDGCGVLVNSSGQVLKNLPPLRESALEMLPLPPRKLPDLFGALTENWSADQPRDKDGRWTGGSGAKTKGKKSKSADRAATAEAEKHLRESLKAREAGDKERARNLLAAGMGYHKAAKAHADGDHDEARRLASLADEFASGKRKLKNKQKS